MSYVAVKGGENAIKHSKSFYFDQIQKAKTIDDDTIADGLFYSIDRITSEGALYSEKLAAEAIRLSGGELLNAAFYLRAHRSTCKRAGEAAEVSLEGMRVIRRISAAFKDIPGGQILGPSSDYVLKVMIKDKGLYGSIDEDTDLQIQPVSQYVHSAVDQIREWGLVKTMTSTENVPFDITRVNPQMPFPRSAAMQTMARGETGAMLAIAYTTMRGYGDVHPAVGELRIGYVDVTFVHPLTGNPVKVGEIRATACEVVAITHDEAGDGAAMKYSVGFGFCFGFNETKAISMGILDNAMSAPSFSVGGKSLAGDPEMVLNHIDGIESLGFCNHYKLPHYVTFQSDLSVVKETQQSEKEAPVEVVK